MTSLSKEEYEGRSLYEELYCGRGEMENRIQEQQLMLFADRTSAEDMRANQIRLYLSSITCVLLSRSAQSFCSVRCVESVLPTPRLNGHNATRSD